MPQTPAYTAASAHRRRRFPSSSRLRPQDVLELRYPLREWHRDGLRAPPPPHNGARKRTPGSSLADAASVC
jgi:hypothetical protein